MKIDDASIARAGWARFTGLELAHPATIALANASQLRRLKRGTALLVEGQLDRTIYLLVSGALRTLRYLSDGQEVWLTDAQPGELVGEMAALADSARTSSVFTRTDASVLAIEPAAFFSVAREHGSVGLAIAKLLALRLAHTSGQIADLAALPVASRLHRELIRIGQPSGAVGELVRIEAPPSVSDLAHRIHASREAASRALRELETRKLVTRSGETWILPMPLEDVVPGGAGHSPEPGCR
ncbi:MAG TPA: Crp/Fnr family transcriptional regulator [Hyphomonadaceae bacterium]|nr:Crp/Fnr family transcriptional regulator [Hyphomonadaceae bacterium]